MFIGVTPIQFHFNQNGLCSIKFIVVSWCLLRAHVARIMSDYIFLGPEAASLCSISKLFLKAFLIIARLTGSLQVFRHYAQVIMHTNL